MVVMCTACGGGGARPSDGDSSLPRADGRPRTSASGEAYLGTGESLPPNAVVRVELRDTMRAQSATAVVATQEFTGQQSPWAFAILAPDSLVGSGAALVLSARINAGDRLLFATGDDTPIIAGSANGPLRIQLLPVTMSEGSGAGPGRLAVTPAPSLTVLCGEERFRVAIEAGALYLTTADGVTITLPRLTRPEGEDPEAARTFTNGRMIIVQEVTGAKRFSFARGRMMPTPCRTA